MNDESIVILKARELREIIREELRANRPQEPDFSSEKMTVGQGAHFIDVSYPTLCNWINDGKVPVHGKGRTRFLLKSELIEAYKNLNK